MDWISAPCACAGTLYHIETEKAAQSDSDKFWRPVSTSPFWFWFGGFFGF